MHQTLRSPTWMLVQHSHLKWRPGCDICICACPHSHHLSGRNFLIKSVNSRATACGEKPGLKAGILVDCVPEEIEQYHLRDLKEDVAKTNQNYRDYLARVARAQKQQEGAEQKEKSRLEDLKSRLEFD